MPFSHHSHSGEFCMHAKDKLAEVVEAAVSRRMTVLALTEHMPRDRRQDLYPEEEAANVNPEDLDLAYSQFYKEARRLQAAYAGSITLLVGMEIDWIRDSSHALIQSLLSRYQLDLIIGSVHHVHEIPIDFDRAEFGRAMSACTAAAGAAASREDLLFEDYFDHQLRMLKALRPPVVGHFDLIRLHSSSPNASLRDRPGPWEKAVRNLEFVKEYGGLLEVNSAGLRKGMAEPYPQKALVQHFHGIGGAFVLSDDSHGVDQIAVCYTDTVSFISDCGVTSVTVLERSGPTLDSRFAGIGARQVPVAELRSHPFWCS